jgi:hypothetical protein
VATRVVRDSHDEIRHQFWFLVVANVVTAVAIVLCVLAFRAMVR